MYTMKRLSPLFLFFAILLFPSSAFAQFGPVGAPTASTPQGKIIGTVKDGTENKPLEYATVTVRKVTDNKLINGGITDASGKFTVDKLPFGKYNVDISFMGFTSKKLENVELKSSAPTFNAGTVVLTLNENASSVEVAGDREFIESRVDKRVYNLKNSPIPTDGTAHDMLGKLPEIQQDQNGNIQVRGQDVTILMDGRPLPMEGEQRTAFLKQLPANMVANVELVTSPSARNDARGSGGAIVNLVMKKGADQPGLIGGGLTLGYTNWDRGSVSGNFNYKKQKLSTFTTYSFRHDIDRSFAATNRANLYANPINYLLQDNTSQTTTNGHTFDARLDYGFNDKTNLSFTGLITRGLVEDKDNIIYTLLDSKQLALGSAGRNGFKSGDNLSTNLSLALDQKFGKDHTLSTSISRASYGDNYNTDYTNTGAISGSGLSGAQQEASDNSNSTITAEAKYTQPLKKKMKFETGYKGTFRTLNNNFNYFNQTNNAYVLDPVRSNGFDYNDNTQALFAVLSNEINKKMSYELGVRYEQTTLDGKVGTSPNIKRTFRNAFPSIGLLYKVASGKQWSLNYNQQTMLPRIEWLNPTTRYIDPLNLDVGNPNLKPMSLHNASFGYTQFSAKGFMNVATFYNLQTDALQRVQSINATTGVATTSFTNYDNVVAAGAVFVASRRFSPKFNLMLTLLGLRLSFNANNVTEIGTSKKTSSLTGIPSLQATYNLSKTTTLNMNANYRGKIEFNQGYLSPSLGLDMNLTQKLLKNKATLTLRIADPLNANRFKINLANTGYSMAIDNKPQSRLATVTFSWNFGKVTKPKEQPQNQQAPAPSGWGM
jgi:outer membrane receptor protein involved in Fe transport